MNKKDLGQDLLNNGFNLTNYRNYEKICNNLRINVIIYSSLFGKIKMLGIFYKFKKQLKEDLHDEVWNKSRQFIDSQNTYLKIGSLGFDYIEADIVDKGVLNNINANIVNENCLNFANQINELLKEYDL